MQAPCSPLLGAGQNWPFGGTGMTKFRPQVICEPIKSAPTIPPKLCLQNVRLFGLKTKQSPQSNCLCTAHQARVGRGRGLHVQPANPLPSATPTRMGPSRRAPGPGPGHGMERSVYPYPLRIGLLETLANTAARTVCTVRHTTSTYLPVRRSWEYVPTGVTSITPPPPTI